MYRKSGNKNAYTSPTAKLTKKQKTTAGRPEQSNNRRSPLQNITSKNDWTYSNLDLFEDGKPQQPRDIQQRFLQKLNMERQQMDKNNHSELLQEIQCSNIPDICSSPKSKNDPTVRSMDSDSMFGDDIPMDDIEEFLVMNNKENKELLFPSPLTKTRSSPSSPLKNIVSSSCQSPARVASSSVTASVPPSSSNIYNDNEDDDDDMFGDDIPLDLLDEPLPSNITQIKKETRSQNDIKAKPLRYSRYMVANVHMGQYRNGDTGLLPEKVIQMLDDVNTLPARARLRDAWIQTYVQVGDIVHIPVGANQVACNDVIIDNAHGYFIIHPDRLISSTAVAESFFCLRKSVLQQKVKTIGDYSEALVHGNLIHRIIQSALQSGDFTLEGLREEAQRSIQASLEELHAINQDEDTALGILEKTIGFIKSFGDIYVGSKPKKDATIANDIGPDAEARLGCKNIAISKVLDVEEHLWSPTYGLKGMVDASIEMVMQPNGKIVTAPLELKTGKSSRFISHRAQTILYTLLMSDRYDVDINVGALFYCRTNSLYMAEQARNDVRALIMARNRLATAMQNRHTLPAMLKNPHSCQHCSMDSACILFHKSVENGDGASSGLSGWFDTRTDHLNDNATAMFRHWQRLIDLEEDDIDYIRRDIWRMTAELRELTGRCWNNMIYDTTVEGSSGSIASFRRHPDSNEKLNLLTSMINVGDPIVISSTQGHINLGMGFVLRLDQNSIQINLTSPLRRTPERGPNFHEDLRQVFVNNGQTTNYRIDKDEMSSGMALMRRNIVTLFTREEDGGDVKRRRLIVDRVKPSFVPPKSIDDMPPSLNPGQQHAVEKVLSAKDYAIILGMPGTGKTTTTAQIIKTLVERNKSVLLTAYTHTALDNVLVKVRESGIDVLRLGNPEKVLPSLRSSMPNDNPNLTTVDSLGEFYDSKKVVGVTCLGIGHNLFLKRKFDYCIVDEASQITLPACVGPLRCADVFVLVGDQYQLPPLVRNDAARDNGLQKSLFALLAEAHPEAIAYLEYQYRMNEDIMTISNTLIYDNKLKCANEFVAKRELQLPYYQQALNTIHTGGKCSKEPCWIEQVLDPSRKVVFLDTDQMSGIEERILENVINNVEASLVFQLAEALLAAGVPEEQLAVISVYRSQLRLISQSLHGRPKVEIATIDKYQGRDKECVLVSLVRKNETGKTGELLRDWRRINVAFTRAKSKIIIIGSSKTLCTSALFNSFIELMRVNKWIYQLHQGAQDEHIIQSPPSPQKRKREHKTHSPIEAMLKTRPILRDVYNSSY